MVSHCSACTELEEEEEGKMAKKDGYHTCGKRMTSVFWLWFHCHVVDVNKDQKCIVHINEQSP